MTRMSTRPTRVGAGRLHPFKPHPEVPKGGTSRSRSDLFMNKNRWTVWHKAVAVAVLVSPGILGVSTGAMAATTTTISATETGRTAPPVAALSIDANTSPGIDGSPSSTPETRGRLSPFISALRKIPVLFAAVVNGAKKAYAWFVSNVWPAVQRALNVAWYLISAWELWNYFH